MAWIRSLLLLWILGNGKEVDDRGIRVEGLGGESRFGFCLSSNLSCMWLIPLFSRKGSVSGLNFVLCNIWYLRLHFTNGMYINTLQL